MMNNLLIYIESSLHLVVTVDGSSSPRLGDRPGRSRLSPCWRCPGRSCTPAPSSAQKTSFLSRPWMTFLSRCRNTASPREDTGQTWTITSSDITSCGDWYLPVLNMANFRAGGSVHLRLQVNLQLVTTGLLWLCTCVHHLVLLFDQRRKSETKTF